LNSFPGCHRKEGLVLPGESFIRDCSLFGNESEDSDFDELELITKDFPLAENTKLPVAPNKTKAFCFLRGEELVCEADGEAEVLCLRLCKASEPKILISIKKNIEGEMERIRVKENDILIMIEGKICEEGVIETIKKSNKSSKKPIKEVVNYLESTNKKATIIVARISRRI